MKTAAACLSCYVRQTLQTATIVGADEETQRRAIVAVATLLPDLSPDKTPPENSMAVYGKIAEITGIADPYRAVKAASNREAMSALESLQPLLNDEADPLPLALRFTVAGNIIDYGAAASFDVEAAFRRCREMPLTVDHSAILLDRIRALSPGDTVLYLADNCGEIVYDRLFIEYIVKTACRVVVAVKAGPIINDALHEDAKSVGLGEFAEIIDNGATCPGTPLDVCSAEFLRHFRDATLIIAKGQGNFESLSGCGREIFFLLTVKCPVVGAHLAELAGVSPADLPGLGEMAVFHYNPVQS